MSRHFEADSKFWRIAVDGSSTLVEYGAIGAAPRPSKKDHADAKAAQAFADKMIKEKLGKGYVEVGGGAEATASPADSAPAKRKQGAKKAKEEPIEIEDDDEEEEPKTGKGKAKRKAAPAKAKAPPAKRAKPAAPAPADPTLEDDDEDGPQDLAPPSDIPPPKALPNPGDTMKVASHSSSAQYVLKHHADGSFSCSCPAWRNQGGAPPDARTCKHLREAVGDAHEDARLRARGADPEKPVSRKPAGSSSSAGGGSKAKKKAPALLLANTYDGADPAGFHLSEKLDGVRAFWDPAARLLLSRLGNPFPAPAWFLDALPADRSLDGELFLGRGMFSRTVSAVKTAGGAWEGVEYRLFDVPSEGAKPFEERMEVLKGIVKAASGSRAKLVFVEQTPCTSREHLDAELARVLRLGGEGLMLRKPGSKYEGRRSATLLKLKKFYDAEAKVVGYQPGKGKYKGMTGSLEAEMECGKRFFVGSGMSDAERKSPPKIGTIISYAFQELTDDGVPRFPTYRGVALDKKKAKDAVVRTVSKADDDESLEDEQ